MDKSVCCYLVVVHKESRERLLEEFDVSLPKRLARAASQERSFALAEKWRVTCD